MQGGIGKKPQDLSRKPGGPHVHPGDPRQGGPQRRLPLFGLSIAEVAGRAQLDEFTAKQTHHGPSSFLEGLVT